MSLSPALLPLLVSLAAAPASHDIPAPASGLQDEPVQPPADWEASIGEDAPLDGRRRPGFNQPLPEAVTQDNRGAIRPPPPEAFPTDQIPLPDRWRLIETLGLVKERWFDPYHQNTYKGDRPLCIPTEEEQAERKAHGRPRCATPKL
ncbi:MAG: hypothetical protein ABW184_05555, partial [Sphingobium sp.]